MPQQHRAWWPSADQQLGPVCQRSHEQGRVHGTHEHGAHAATHVQHHAQHGTAEDGLLAELEALLLAGTDTSASEVAQLHLAHQQPSSVGPCQPVADAQPTMQTSTPSLVAPHMQAHSSIQPSTAALEPPEWAWQSSLIAAVSVVLTGEHVCLSMCVI